MKDDKTEYKSATHLFNVDCIKLLHSPTCLSLISGKRPIIVTDPPFNIGYHYNTYKDKKHDDEYYEWLAEVFLNYPFAVIHYPEAIYKIAFQIGKFPERVVSWVYNSNTAKQHRDIAFFDIKPDFNLVSQPYKNPKDKRIQKLIAGGKCGGRLYDWWNVNQTKNVSKEKTQHPCQMPVEVMNNIIGIIPDKKNIIVIDPFMGSGTTGIACQNHNVDFIGCEIDKEYFEIAKNRMNLTVDDTISSR